MRKRVAGVLLALSIGASAAPEEGIVYARYYYPESQWIQMVCVAYNKQGLCSTQVPVVQTAPERWTLGLRNGEDEGERHVTEHEYNTYKVGDHYP